MTDSKKITSNTKTPFWQGSNFYVALVLMIGGFFVGFPEGDAKHFVEMLFATVAGGFGLREQLKNLRPDAEKWVLSGNFVNYLMAAIVAVVPTFPNIGEALQQTLSGILGGNWQGILTGIFSLATMLFYWVKDRNKTPAPVSASK